MYRFINGRNGSTLSPQQVICSSFSTAQSTSLFTLPSTDNENSTQPALLKWTQWYILHNILTLDKRRKVNSRPCVLIRFVCVQAVRLSQITVRQLAGFDERIQDSAVHHCLLHKYLCQPDLFFTIFQFMDVFQYF